MKKLIKAKRSGFTLVELLIVIMIIAILAGMMMLASGSATDTANATKVINDLRGLKSATTLAVLDSGYSLDDILNGSAPIEWNAIWIKISDAMDSPIAQEGQSKVYNLITAQATIENVDRWLIGFYIDTNTFDYLRTESVQQKLADQAQKVGLYNSAGEFFKVGDDFIGMIFQ